MILCHLYRRCRGWGIVRRYFPTKILLATDGSEGAELAARAAADLARRTASLLHVVHVWRVPHPPSFVGSGPSDYSSWRAGFEREAEEVLSAQTLRVRSAGAAVAGIHLRNGRPADEIADLVQEIEAGLVILGSRGLGPVQRLLLGSVSEGVVNLAPVPTLVIRGEAWPPARVVVGEDLSGEAKRAAELGVTIGSVYGAEVILLLAYPKLPKNAEASAESSGGMVGTTSREELEGVEEALGEVIAGLEDDLGYPVRAQTVRGDAASAIQEVCEDSEIPTLAVIGSRGLGATERTVLGSVSADVVKVVEGPVLIVKTSAE